MSSLGEKALEAKGIPFASHTYDYRKKGAEAAAEALDVELSATVKTLVISCSDGRFLFLLVPGGRAASMRQLARTLGVKSCELASERDAQRLTAYKVGGIGPFGSRTPLDVYVDLAVFEHDTIYINGGRRGLLLAITPDHLLEATEGELVEVSQTS